MKKNQLILNRDLNLRDSNQPTLGSHASLIEHRSSKMQVDVTANLKLHDCRPLQCNLCIAKTKQTLINYCYN